jgi:GxxExxY protein
VYYREHLLGKQRLDLLVADLVIVEVKAVEEMTPVFKAQVISYLAATGLRLGYLINFNIDLLKYGIHRIVR